MSKSFVGSLLLAFLAVSSFAASEAGATSACPETCGNICLLEDDTTFVRAEVVATDVANARVRIAERYDDEAVNVAIGDERDVYAPFEVVVGESVFVSITQYESDTYWNHAMPIRDGRVQCQYDVTVDLATYVAMAQSESDRCFEIADEVGAAETCRNSGVDASPGCASVGSGTPSGAIAASILVGIALLRRRKCERARGARCTHS